MRSVNKLRPNVNIPRLFISKIKPQTDDIGTIIVLSVNSIPVQAVASKSLKYSRHLGRGGRKFLNLYSGYNIGYLMYSGKKSSLKNFYVSPAIGIELFKNNFMLIDTKMTYMLPFTDNLYLRGFQFAVAVNFVF